MRPEEVVLPPSVSPHREDPSFVPGSTEAVELERFAESTSYDQMILPLEMPHIPEVGTKQRAHLVSLALRKRI